ncbi:MAG TPA: SRPBCC family protein [Rugosimonospora sp.]
MRLENEFVVPRPVDEAWTVLTDVERIAPCMPGAQLTEVVGDSYHGTVRVKVGPVVAQYGGAVRFTEMDAERHHVVLEAKGKERNGRGLASAVVTAELTAQGGSTRVTVSTDLTISGPLAQFGRGAIAEVSARLLNQFVDRLKETVLQDSGTATPDATLDHDTVNDATLSGAALNGATVDGGTAATSGDAVDGGSPPAGKAAPADLLRVAAVPILKRLLPLLILIVVVIVVLVLWLG